MNKILPVIVNIYCVLAFSIHTAINVWTNIYSDKTYTDTKLVKLGNISFPVVFQISFSPGLDTDEINRLGFLNTYNYLQGIRGDQIGWHETDENGAVLKNASGLFLRGYIN